MPLPAFLLPALFAGGGFLANLLGGKDKNQGTQIPPGPFADWLQTGLMPSTGGGGGGGGTSKSTTSQNMLETRNLLNMPVIAEQFRPLIDMAVGTLEQRSRFPKGLPPEYAAQGIQQTNRTFDVIQQALGNKLSGMGALGSPAGQYPVAVMETGRGQAIADFQNRLPELAREWQNQDIGLSQALTQALGLGQRQTGTVHTKGTSTTQGQTSGGGGGGSGQRYDFSGPLSYLQMQQQAQNKPGFFEQILPVLGLLFGSGAFGGGGKGGSSGAPTGWQV